MFLFYLCIEYYKNIPEATLKERINTYEQQTYMNATSRADYLQKIAEGLTKAENKLF